MTTAYIGQPISRIDGRAKVTGGARYAAEHAADGLLYGYVVTSTIARGRITRIDASDALALPGVIKVLTHENVPRLARPDHKANEASPPGVPFVPLQDNEVRFSFQPVALVLAETFELARYAATLVRIEYEQEAHHTDLEAALGAGYEPKRGEPLLRVPKPRGNAAGAFASAAAQIDAEYWVPAEHHNPMELFATTVVPEENGTLTVHDKNQGVQNVRRYLCSLFGYPEDRVRVLSPFIGGAFGAGLSPQYQVVLAVLAAHVLKRSIKVTLTRQQMFGLPYRPVAWQRVALGASRDGKLEAIVHDAVSDTSRFEDYSERIVNWSELLYQCDNVSVGYKVSQLDLNTPCDMRAPGAAWGLYALECAMDELAVKLSIDPIELRLRNYAETDQNTRLPFSSKALRDCYRQGAERFGWSRRTLEPRSMRDGSTLVGWGMASGMWDAFQAPATVRCVIGPDGKAEVSSATEDIGTGTYTIMTQVAAETLGLPIENVTFKLGDSSLPRAPLEGGSFTAASVGSAVQLACESARHRLFELTREDRNSPLRNANPDDLMLADGHVRSRRDPSKAISIVDVMRRANLESIDELAATWPSREHMKHSCYAHSAVFAEVHVDEDLGTIRVPRVVSAVAAGRILNPKTARSQMLGGVVWGIGMALEEESVIDHAFGRIVNASLGEYHVPVNADISDIDVMFVDEPDEIVNPLGVKGVGEIGLVGVAAAISNAVYHATGKRIRKLPITLDMLL